MKKICLFLLLLAGRVALYAQSFTPPAFADVDNNYRTYVNQVFGALEANRVPTGFLADYGFDFTDPKIYNGSVLVDSTLMEQGIYTELYKTIFTSKFNSNAGTLRHPSIHDSLCYIARQKEVITLSGLLFKYNAIDPNAQVNGKMQTVSGQLKDKYVSGTWQNPYHEFTTVAISPSVITYNLTYGSVVLPSSLFLSNMLSQVSTIQFNADDGLGYQNISFDVSLPLNYADTGWKHWMFKVTLTGGQQLYSHSKVHFSNTSNIAGSGGNVALRGVPDINRQIMATEAFNGVFGVADIVISYRDENDPVLRRPLIVAEGFDPGWIIRPEEPEGENTFAGFVGSVRNSRSAALQNLIADAFDQNAASQYDLVYINWRNGTDFLQRNALVLEAVIRWVNANKQPDLNTGLMNPNVVLGSSMGGVVARMALGRMDRGGGQNGAGGFAAHQTSLYISLDAPHQGANVPLGYQAAARHATRMYVSTGGLVNAVETIQLLRNGPSPLLSLLLADQPASRQMLINRIDLSYNPDNLPNQQFLQELRTQWAYPNPNNTAGNVRCIAISNGSECAIDQEFAAGSSLLYHFRSTKTRFIGDLIFMAAGAGLAYVNAPLIVTIPLVLPGSNKFELTLDIKALANGGGNAVYYGNIKLTKKVLWLVPVNVNIANKTYNAPTGLLPFDTYPGGFYTLFLANQPGSVSQDWMFTYNNSFYIQRRFSFIPTTSALDIGLGNTTLTNPNYLAKYIGGTPPTTPLNTPFANFTTSFNRDGRQWEFDNDNFRRLNNEPHEGLLIRTANWLAAEMAIINPQPQFTNCSAFCNNGIIEGAATFCLSETYTAPFGNGVTYNWIVDKPWLVTTSAIGNTFQITRTGNSSAELTITVQMTGDCGPTTLTRNVTMGYPMVYYNISPFNSGNECYQPNNFYYFNIQPGANDYLSITGYEWGYRPLGTGNETIIGDPNQPNSMVSVVFPSTGQYEVFVRPRNACGAGLESTYPVEVVWNCSGGGWFRVSTAPNPTKDDIYVTIDEEKQEVKNLSSNENVQMSLYDFNTMKMVRTWRLKNDQKQYKLDARTVKKGMYVLVVTKGKYQQTQKVILE